MMTTLPQLETLPAPLRPEVERLWEDLQPALRDPLLENATVIGSAAAVWAMSPFVAQVCRSDPAMIAELIGSGDLLERYPSDGYATRLAARDCPDESALMLELRRFRRREMVRIAWRDLAGWADTDETLAALSALADAAIRCAVEHLDRWLQARYGVPRDADGTPQELLVLGMGKLGGGELNFSSDIDLIFCFPSEGESDGTRSVSNGQYFTRLGQKLIRALDEPTDEGFVFRTDMRLRPWGDAGPLAMQFDALESYYQSQGRSWERYAMIKARPITGSEAHRAALEGLLRPFIFRRYLDFGAFESLREMKGLIEAEEARRGMGDNIKLGPGGIREIEFIGQAFQLIRGGRQPDLQLRGIRQVLAQLAASELLPLYVVEQLAEAYEFLRRSENRLQMLADRQTQILPQEPLERLRHAFAMGFSDWERFITELDRHRRRVHGHFESVFSAPQVTERDQQGPDPALELWQGRLDETRGEQLLRALGYQAPEQAGQALERLAQSHAYRQSSEQAHTQMDRAVALAIPAAGQCPLAERALARVLAVFESVARRPVYLSLLAEHPMALSQLVKLCDASPWISGYLGQHPILLDELLDPRTLYAPPTRESLRQELEEALARCDPADDEAPLNALRHFKQVNSLRVAAADISGVLPLMRVSDHLTEQAEVALDAVLELTQQRMAQRHGQPRCVIDGQRHAPTLAVAAYGKLGGIELGYGSDLDIVFLNDSSGDRQESDGDRPLANPVYFARMTQRMINIITTPTAGGTLYEVDTRLRPDGNSGLLTHSLEAFERYQRESAWTWEHQALVRARIVAGSSAIGERFNAIRHSILSLPRDPAKLAQEVAEMRERMRRELGSKASSRFHLKQDEGGIADIEFIVQYGVLAWSAAHPSLTTYTDNIRILEGFAREGLLADEEAESLAEIYRAYRARGHRLALQEQSNELDAAEFQEERTQVRRIWERVLGGEL